MIDKYLYKLLLLMQQPQGQPKGHTDADRRSFTPEEVDTMLRVAVIEKKRNASADITVTKK